MPTSTHKKRSPRRQGTSRSRPSGQRSQGRSRKARVAYGLEQAIALNSGLLTSPYTF